MANKQNVMNVAIAILGIVLLFVAGVGLLYWLLLSSGMDFQNLQWLYWTVPLLAVLVGVRYWRRHYWGHSLVEYMRERMGSPNPILRLPTLLEALAVGFLLVALLGPVYPFVLQRIERGGLQILFVLDLSQSMEEGLRAPGSPRSATSPMPGAPGGGQSKMAAVKASAVEFVRKRQGDAIGLAVFSNNAYLVTPATFDHASLEQYLHMVNSQTLVNEGFTAIGEGLYTANRFFDFNEQQGGRRKGQVIILFSDGDQNYGRDPMEQIEKARTEGTRIYFIGVALEQGAAQQIVDGVQSTGGRYFDVSSPQHLEEAFTEIDQTEKGRFFTIQLVRNRPAYKWFVALALLCLALRMLLNGIPHFVEIS